MLKHLSTPARLCALTCLLLLATGCVHHRHSIGLGATGTGEQSARLAPYGTVARQGELDLAGFFILLNISFKMIMGREAF